MPQRQSLGTNAKSYLDEVSAAEIESHISGAEDRTGRLLYFNTARRFDKALLGPNYTTQHQIWVSSGRYFTQQQIFRHHVTKLHILFVKAVSSTAFGPSPRKVFCLQVSQPQRQVKKALRFAEHLLPKTSSPISINLLQPYLHATSAISTPTRPAISIIPRSNGTLQRRPPNTSSRPRCSPARSLRPKADIQVDHHERSQKWAQRHHTSRQYHDRTI